MTRRTYYGVDEYRQKALGRAAAIANDAPTLSLGGATPYTLFLARSQRMLKADDTHCTLFADRLRCGRFFIFIRKKQAGIEPSTGAQFPPNHYFGRHD